MIVQIHASIRKLYLLLFITLKCNFLLNQYKYGLLSAFSLEYFIKIFNLQLSEQVWSHSAFSLPVMFLAPSTALFRLARQNPKFFEAETSTHATANQWPFQVRENHVPDRAADLWQRMTDILRKSLRGPQIHYICSKLGAFNLYALAWGKVFEMGCIIGI